MFRLNIQAGPGWKRKRMLFARKADGEAAVKEFQDKVYTHGGAGATVTQEAAVVLSRWLESFSLSQLDDIFAAAIKQKERGQITVSELFERYTASSRANKAGALHLSDLSHRFKRFELTFGERPISAVRSGEILDWLDKLDLAPLTKKNYVKVIRLAFGYAVTHEMLDVSPVARIKMRNVAKTAPGVLTVEQMTLLLVYGDRMARWFFVLGGFLGLRTSEARRVTADHFNLEDGHLAVTHLKTSAKGMRDRYVDLIEPARAWIEFLKLPAKGKKVIPYSDKSLRWHVRAALEAAGTSWVNNGLRHSFCSYHLAANEDAAKTAALAGHTSSRTTYAEYFRLRTRKQGQAWFALTPELIRQKAKELAAESLAV